MSTNNATTANLYPFVTKAQIKERLEQDPQYRRQAMVILFALQTAYEQDTSTTLSKNRQGFMSSHSVWGTRIAKKLNAGEELSAEEVGKMDAIAPRYSRQLAVHFRAQMIAEQPALKAVAALFSAAGKDAPEGDETEQG